MGVAYFVSKGLGDQELDVGPSGQGATTSEKGEVATQGYESEDMEILEIPEEERLIIEPLAEEPATREAFVETTAAEGVIPLEIAPEDVTGSKATSPVAPTIKISSADIAAIEIISLEVIHTEATRSMIISTEVAIADISAIR